MPLESLFLLRLRIQEWYIFSLSLIKINSSYRSENFSGLWGTLRGNTMKFCNSFILLELRILLAENIRAQYKITTLRVHENLATVLIFGCLVADKITLLMQFSAANWKKKKQQLFNFYMGNHLGSVYRLFAGITSSLGHLFYFSLASPVFLSILQNPKSLNTMLFMEHKHFWFYNPIIPSKSQFLHYLC